MKTYEGARAEVLSVEDQLRRSVLSCLLWEDTFYESGQKIEDRIKTLASQCDSEILAYLAMEARGKYKLRSVPLILANELASRGGSIVSKTLENIIQRPDEIVRFMSMYWEKGKSPIAKQVKKGLSSAFNKFNEYQFAKWNRDGKIKLRDIMFMVHPKPNTVEQGKIFKKLAENDLSVADTWEVGLSSAKTTEEKKQVWERLLLQKKLGGLALLKNMRGMIEANVNRSLIIDGLKNIKVDRILPYRFITADKFVPEYEEYLEGAMYRCLQGRNKIEGKTVLLVDVSGSMGDYLSVAKMGKGIRDMMTTRLDAAKGLAILLKFLCEDVSIYTFSDDVVHIPDASGFRLGKKIDKSQSHNGTYLGKAITKVNKLEKEYDRIIIITDEQSHDNIIENIASKGYIMNVAPYHHGIEHDKKWTRISGFSEAVIDWMIEHEKPLVGWSKELDDAFSFDWSVIK
jgi:hypothetical protein